jgi:uncharacterized ion transporter superfamily protein YfcC
MNKRKIRIPHTFAIIFFLIVVSAVMTFLIPGGEYNRETLEFSYKESNPQSWQIFSAFFDGFKRQSGIIAFILVIGASFWVLNSTKAIDAGILSFLNFTRRVDKVGIVRKLGANNIIITMIMLMFSLFGAVFGMSEETIAFTVIIVPLAISMGYDSITGVAMVYVAAHVGFAGAVLNPFTIGIAQDIAGLPVFSGMEYRFVCWLILNIITIAVVLLYASKVKKRPESSVVYKEDEYWRSGREEGGNVKIEYYNNRSSWFVWIAVSLILAVFSVLYPESEIRVGSSRIEVPLMIPLLSVTFVISSFLALKKSVHFFVLDMLLFTILFLITGVMGYGWYIGEISALFLGLGIASGAAAGYGSDLIVKKLTEGAKDILSAAVVVGLAAGIIVILEEGMVVDTILYRMSESMKGSGRETSLGVMYAIQTFINIIIPSASAKAAITMPIMAPFADLIGVSRQATVLAFQFGDGFTNMITPTSGILIAVLGIARIPYIKWFKLVIPFILLLIITGFLLLLPTIYFDLAGFGK